ncbi:hypothetical protein DPMN_163750 [Dreissena polymorpha]|uniref:Uncharacterized protein n=2 Tax=Dreissena polymorpha TaxID=45954 RepID=A0A9D4ETV6_DREPO|nr:hypothetical protein DPMN_163750 [Dreissena polymorpha]
MDCHCDKCHHIDGSCAMSSQCHDGYMMDNGFCKHRIQIPSSAVIVTSNGTLWDNWTADKVNQGSLRQDANDCKCCAALARPSWVQLTLNKTYIVEKVLVLGRSDNFVQFANITVSMGLMTEFLQDEQFTIKHDTVAEKWLNPPREIQFVRVMGSGSGYYMTICEIVIYRPTDCPLGRYSVNCSKQCHCRVGSCDSVTGACWNGNCEDGWNGMACNETCQSGSYGQNCSMDCHCDKCHHINGSCAMSSQCHDGYRMDNGFCKPNEDTKQSLTIIWIVTTLGLCLLVVGVTIASLCIRRKKIEAKKKALKTAQQIELQPSNRAQVLPDDTHDDNIVHYEVVPDAITKHEATSMYESLQMADMHLYSGLREAMPMSPAPFDVLGLIAESKTPVRRHFALAEELDNATSFESKYTTAEEEENDNAAETNYADFELLENDSEEGNNYEAVNKEYQFVK